MSSARDRGWRLFSVSSVSAAGACVPIVHGKSKDEVAYHNSLCPLVRFAILRMAALSFPLSCSLSPAACPGAHWIWSELNPALYLEDRIGYRSGT